MRSPPARAREEPTAPPRPEAWRCKRPRAWLPRVPGVLRFYLSIKPAGGSIHIYIYIYIFLLYAFSGICKKRVCTCVYIYMCV